MASHEAQLVARTLRGDKLAFSDLVRRHQGRLLAAAIHLVGDTDTAQDLTQEAFVEAYRGLGGLQDREKFGGWVYGILRNRCRRYLSRRPPRALSLEADNVPEPTVTDPDPSPSDLTALLHTLPQESREVLAGRYLHDMSYTEIGEMLGISAGNARIRCFRAREALREILSGNAAAALVEGGGC